MNFCFFSRESHTKFIYTYICTSLYGYSPAIDCKLYRYGVIVDSDPCIVYEHKTKGVPGQGLSIINLSLFVCFFDVCRACYPFPSISYARKTRMIGQI